MNPLDTQFDLVILNGRVMDPETGLDAVRNVGVAGGKIAAITDRPLQGRETIDATGHVVAPGFIDGHCHAANDAFAVKCGLRDGKTTQMDLEMGAWPVDKWYDCCFSSRTEPGFPSRSEPPLIMDFGSC